MWNEKRKKKHINQYILNVKVCTCQTFHCMDSADSGDQTAEEEEEENKINNTKKLKIFLVMNIITSTCIKHHTSQEWVYAFIFYYKTVQAFSSIGIFNDMRLTWQYFFSVFFFDS